MPEAITAGGLVKYAPVVAKTLKELGVFDSVLDFLRGRQRYNVVLLGASGTGKSTFVDHMFGKPTKISGEFRTALNKSHFGKIDNHSIHFLDTPGQYNEPYLSERKEAIRRAATMKPLGIINVVADGYHEGPVSVTNVVQKEAVKPGYLAERRGEELTQLEEWADLLCGRGGSAKWVMTVVSKADLWWLPGKEEEVLSTYRAGPYVKRLNRSGPIEHMVFPYCSIHKPFFDRVPMSGFYSDALKENHHERLVAHLLAACARSTK